MQYTLCVKCKKKHLFFAIKFCLDSPIPQVKVYNARKFIYFLQSNFVSITPPPFRPFKITVCNVTDKDKQRLFFFKFLHCILYSKCTELSTTISAVQKKLVWVRYLYGTEPDGRILHNIYNVNIAFNCLSKKS